MASEKSLDCARRAMLIYDQLRTRLEAASLNQFVAIEPESGDYFVGATLTEAIRTARSCHPDRLAYALRIGEPNGIHMGSQEAAPWMKFAGMIDSGDPQSSRRVDEVVYGFHAN